MRKLLLAAGALLLVAGPPRLVLGAVGDGRAHAARAASTRAPFLRRPTTPTPRPGRRTRSGATRRTSRPRACDAIDPARAPVDVFYVHPTSYLGSAWNGPVDDPALNAQTDELSTLIQASAFNGCCAVYGPRYRQAQGIAFVRPGPDAAAAIELAYGDVRAAFRFFLERHSRGRPFILAGHSQGSVLAARLLEQEIAGSALAERLVAAYLIGAPIPRRARAGVPACAAPEADRLRRGLERAGPSLRGQRVRLPRRGRAPLREPAHLAPRRGARRTRS